jgi:hypothetical protein
LGLVVIAMKRREFITLLGGGDLAAHGARRQTKREELKMRVLLFAACILAGLNGSAWAQASAYFGSGKTGSTATRLALMECNPSVSEECRRLMAATKPKQTVRAVRPKKPRS